MSFWLPAEKPATKMGGPTIVEKYTNGFSIVGRFGVCDASPGPENASCSAPQKPDSSRTNSPEEPRRQRLQKV